MAIFPTDSVKIVKVGWKEISQKYDADDCDKTDLATLLN